MALEFLMRYGSDEGSPEALTMTGTTLKAMAAGGLHDQFGGGFHCYSTDALWRVPHFEKMLHDQAQLAMAYLHAYQISGDPAFAATPRDTLDFVLRDMRSPDGGFYSALDADSPLQGNSPRRSRRLTICHPAKSGTRCTMRVRQICSTGCMKSRPTGTPRAARQRSRLGSLSVGEEAEVADADDARWEQMEKEAAEELDDGQLHDQLLVALRDLAPIHKDHSADGMSLEEKRSSLLIRIRIQKSNQTLCG